MPTKTTITQSIIDTYFTRAEQNFINGYVPSLSSKGGFNLLSYLADIRYDVDNISAGELAPLAGAGLAVNGTTLDVNVDNSTIEVNADTVRIKDGGVTPVKQSIGARTRQMQVSLTNLPAPTGANQMGVDRYGFTAPFAMTVTGAKLISSVATIGSDGTNHYEFNLRNITAGNDLAAANTSTFGGEVGFDSPKTITVNQNQALAANDVIALRTDIVDDGGAGPTDLSSASLRLEITFTI